MSVVSSSDAPTASGNAIRAAAGSQWSFGRALSHAVVIMIGVVVGLVIAAVIGLLTGLIEIPIC